MNFLFYWNFTSIIKKKFRMGIVLTLLSVHVAGVGPLLSPSWSRVLPGSNYCPDVQQVCMICMIHLQVLRDPKRVKLKARPYPRVGASCQKVAPSCSRVVTTYSKVVLSGSRVVASCSRCQKGEDHMLQKS